MNVHGSSMNDNDISGFANGQLQKRCKNDIKDIKSYRMLDRIELDLDSPRFIQACNNLGVSIQECTKRQENQEGFNGCLGKKMSFIRKVLKIKQMQKEIIDQKMIAKSASQGQLMIQQPQNQLQNKSFNVPVISQTHFMATTSTAGGLSTSIFPTEVLLIGGDTKKTQTAFRDNNNNMVKSQSVLTHRGISTTQSATSPHNLKFLLTKTAFKETQSTTLASGHYSSRYVGDTGMMSRTMGTTFNENFRNSKTYRPSAHPIVEQRIQTELAKIDRDKSQRLMKVQRELEIQMKKKQKLEEYDERLKKAEEKITAKIKHFSVDKRLKNEKRINEAQQRALNLSKEQEYSILREYEKANQSISGIQLKQIQDQEKRLLIMKREQEFQEKLKSIQEMKQEEEIQEMMSMELRLESIDLKLNRSQMIHRDNLKRVASEARVKNEIVRNKHIQYKNAQEEQEKKDIQDYEDYQNRVKKRLQNTHKEMSSLYENFKQQKQVKVSMNKKNRNEEFMEQKMKLKQIQQRQQEAEDLQEEFKRDQEHEFMLRNELRRLREEDIKKLRDRQRRLQDQRKLQILNKERENDDFMKHIKESESIIQKKKMQENYCLIIQFRETYVQKIKEAEEVKKTMLDIAVKGKVMTPRSKKRLEQEGIMLTNNLSKRKLSLKNFNDNN